MIHLHNTIHLSNFSFDNNMGTKNREEIFILELYRNEPWIFGFTFSEVEFCRINGTYIRKTYKWKIFNTHQNIPIYNYDSN